MGDRYPDSSSPYAVRKKKKNMPYQVLHEAGYHLSLVLGSKTMVELVYMLCFVAGGSFCMWVACILK